MSTKCLYRSFLQVSRKTSSWALQLLFLKSYFKTKCRVHESKTLKFLLLPKLYIYIKVKFKILVLFEVFRDPYFEIFPLNQRNDLCSRLQIFEIYQNILRHVQIFFGRRDTYPIVDVQRMRY